MSNRVDGGYKVCCDSYHNQGVLVATWVGWLLGRVRAQLLL